MKYKWYKINIENIYYMNKNVDIKFSLHEAYLESPSSGTLKVEKLENQMI